MAYQLMTKDNQPMEKEGKQLWASDLVNVYKSTNKEERTLTMIGTDETQDRDGDILTASGWNFENYHKNPVFLWAHNYASVPLARTEKIIFRRSLKRYDFKIKFPNEGINPFADMILALYGEHIVNASSVGFLPSEWEDIVTDEDSPPTLLVPKKFTKKELLELSGCAVPCNPNAVQDMIKQRSFNLDKDIIYDLISGKVDYEPKNKDDILEELDVKCVYEEETSPMVNVPEQIGEGIEKELVTKPEANEHVCDLGKGEYEKYRRNNCAQKHDDKCIDVVYGIKEGKAEISSLRYKKDIWKASDAKSHCASRGGKFFPATSASIDEGEEKLNYSTTYIDEDTIDTIAGTKSGAVLSKKNKDKLNDALKLIQDVLDSSGKEEPKEEKPDIFDGVSVSGSNQPKTLAKPKETNEDDLYSDLLSFGGQKEVNPKYEVIDSYKKLIEQTRALVDAVKNMKIGGK